MKTDQPSRRSPFALDPQVEPREPVCIAAFGSTMVGGRVTPATTRSPDGTVEASIWTDQMYVQYVLPAERRHPNPIVLVHGGSLTGKCFEERPDGGEGWVNYFVRAGFDTYWVDKPWRGRSGFDPTTLNRSFRDGEPGLIPEVHSPANTELLGSKAEEWVFGTQITAEATAEALKQTVPDLTCAIPGAEHITNGGPVVEAALIALLEQIGPAVLLGHSQGGSEVYGPLRSRPELIAALIAVEPAAPPRRDFGAYTGAPVLNMWSGSGPAPDGMRSSDAEQAAVLTEQLVATGADAELIVLDRLGINGSGHMLMQGTTSDEVARVLVDWISRKVEPR